MEQDNNIIGEALWNEAYDSLKEADSELVAAYEKVLSREVPVCLNDAQDPVISSADPRKRQEQMEGLVQVGMKKLGTGGSQQAERTMQGLLGLSDVIGTALQPVPQAALAWVGVSFALQILVNPVTETRACHEGVSYLLLKDNTLNGRESSNLRSKLKEQIIDLYKLLLSRIFRFFQNSIKLNDWEGSLKEIQEAEQRLQSDTTQYSTQQIRSSLEELVAIARDRHARLLLGIQKAIQDHATQQAQAKTDDEDKIILKHLCLTDPRHDMERIEQTKDRLLEGSCHWVLKRPDFSNWVEGNGGTYWIKGDPGKGKTMLLIGIIKEMMQMSSTETRISFFFCQNADPMLNNATSVLRGLIYQLPYDNRGQALFEDTNAFFALKEILSQILGHPNLPKIYLIIDALDECQEDLEPLLELLVEQVSSSRLNCLVSSRPRSEIRNALLGIEAYTTLDLDENAAEDVKEIVKAYIDRKVGTLAKAALVCKQLQKTPVFNVLSVLKSFPSGLPALYGRMMEEVERVDMESPGTLTYCRQILAAVTLAYRPLTLDELSLVANLSPQLVEDAETLEAMIDQCGNFLTVRWKTVYFVHHSAKEYLSTYADQVLFPDGRSTVHSGIVSKALESMSSTLCRDLWGLRDPACSVEDIRAPNLDPLSKIGYMCAFWIEHLSELDVPSQQQLGLHQDGAIGVFIRTHLLHWIEAVCLLRCLRLGEELLKRLANILEDAVYFVHYHQYLFQDTPLQVYTSALLFSPTSSQIKLLFEDQIPSWIETKPLMESDWLEKGWSGKRAAMRIRRVEEDVYCESFV
ncbi:NACHT domain-containing protein [Aspergillus heterothallicus]